MLEVITGLKLKPLLRMVLAVVTVAIRVVFLCLNELHPCRAPRC